MLRTLGLATAGWLATYAGAQSDALITGNGWLDIENHGTAPSALPTPGGLGNYAGQPATLSQVARSDGNGNLLFFGVDGNIYDAEGYLIADAQGPGCTSCIYSGTMEMIAVPIPGQCFMYYLLSMNADDDPAIGTGETHIQVSFLDMAAVNPGTGRFGVVHRFEDMDDVYPPFSGFVNSLSAISASSVTGLLSAGSGEMKSSAPRLRVIDPTGTGDHYFLYALVAGKVFTYEIGLTGIYPINLQTPFNGRVRTIESLNPAAADSYVRDADLRMLPNGRIMLAMTGGGMNVWHPTTNTFDQVAVQALVMEFNGTTGQFLDVDGVRLDGSSGSPDMSLNGTPTGVPTYRGTKGIAIVDGGNGLLIAGEQITNNVSAPNIIHWDLINASWSDIGALYATADLPQVARVRMYHSTFPGTLQPAVLLPKAGGFAAFVGTENTFTMSYEPLFSLGSPNFHIPFFEAPFGTAAVEPEPRFLNAQIVNDQYASGYAGASIGACCVPFNDIRSEHGLLLTTNANWSPANNPFGTSGEVRFSGDLVVASGTTLSLTNMTLRFAADAKLIIQRGATVDAAYSIFTSYDCEGQRWPGIRVEGNTDNLYQAGNNPTLPLAQEQGRIYLHTCTVENAETGVWCGRELPSGIPDEAYHGGVLQAVHSTFRDCIVGARIQRYTRTDGQLGFELNNWSYFRGCSFLTTEDWPDAPLHTPVTHLFLNGVHGIEVTNCAMRNTAPQLFSPSNKGYGIFAFDAGFQVMGDDDPDASAFENLNIGVMAYPGPMETYTVDQMHFLNNMWGIYDMSSVAAQVSRNSFLVPDQGEFANIALGLLLHASRDYTVEENTFFGHTADRSVGIYFLGPVEAENRIYNNSFAQLFAGTLVHGRHKGHTPGFEYDGLQLLCGDYVANTTDWALLDGTYINQEQGHINQSNIELSQLAGNRWLDPANLTSSFDIFITYQSQTEEEPPQPTPFFNYKRHDVLVCDPLNLSTYFLDQPQDEFDVFLKEEACGQSDLDIETEGPIHMQEQHALAAERTRTAIDRYRAEVNDGLKEEDLLALINSSLASHLLRNQLLDVHNLSATVLLAAIGREQPMDPWHLTQVLVANKRLNSQVLQEAELCGLLSPYQLQLLEGPNQQGEAFRLLADEIAARGAEKARWQRPLLRHLLTDSTVQDRSITLAQTLNPYPTLGDMQLLHDMHGWLGEPEAEQWADSLRTYTEESMDVMRIMDSLRIAMPTWPYAHPAVLPVLNSAMEKPEVGATLARALAHVSGLSKALPTLELPDLEDRQFVRPQRRVAPAQGTAATGKVQVFPNPAQDHTFVILPTETATTVQLNLYDHMGRAVKEQRSHTRGSIVELNLDGLAGGSYVCEVVMDGEPMQNIPIVVTE
ncbi:MAG: T9SS type A sorting domain-containing protein [Flavobacteriales bacterium]|nr:T9SS type A sorting domain-containing protein [Flavobacteriales bacterium]